MSCDEGRDARSHAFRRNSKPQVLRLRSLRRPPLRRMGHPSESAEKKMAPERVPRPFFGVGLRRARLLSDRLLGFGGLVSHLEVVLDREDAWHAICLHVGD